jgi:hypothetical protein
MTIALDKKIFAGCATVRESLRVIAIASVIPWIFSMNVGVAAFKTRILTAFAIWMKMAMPPTLSFAWERRMP